MCCKSSPLFALWYLVYVSMDSVQKLYLKVATWGQQVVISGSAKASALDVQEGVWYMKWSQTAEKTFGVDKKIL